MITGQKKKKKKKKKKLHVHQALRQDRSQCSNLLFPFRVLAPRQLHTPCDSPMTRWPPRQVRYEAIVGRYSHNAGEKKVR